MLAINPSAAKDGYLASGAAERDLEGMQDDRRLAEAKAPAAAAAASSGGASGGSAGTGRGRAWTAGLRAAGAAGRRRQGAERLDCFVTPLQEGTQLSSGRSLLPGGPRATC